jgi:hypothetical protein
MEANNLLAVLQAGHGKVVRNRFRAASRKSNDS